MQPSGSREYGVDHRPLDALDVVVRAAEMVEYVADWIGRVCGRGDADRLQAAGCDADVCQQLAYALSRKSADSCKPTEL